MNQTVLATARLTASVLLLAGCKIQVIAPQGGSVTTESGNYLCEAGNSCQIEVTDTLFSETFTVVANDGYEFVGWRSRDKGLCGGSTEACTLFTSGFAGNEALLAFLASDEVFYLEAVFSNGSDWIVNTENRSQQIFEPASNQGVLEDVQSVSSEAGFIAIQTNGIPNYNVLVSEALIEDLNNRPRAGSDFTAGITTLAMNEVAVFGEDIGYASQNSGNCSDTGGGGYWPPGPVCPVGLEREEFFTESPSPTDDDCESGLGTIGLMVNGTAIFNWGDGMSFGNNVWFNLAPIAEQFDVDICGGHAANGEYHHHFYTSCLAELVGDHGNSHSPIYGYAADGYPVYGPWEADGVLAVSGWDTRDYGADSSEGGCGTPGERTCVLVDAYDRSAGVDGNVTQGPDVGETVTTLSGNELAATDGYYLEDYFFAGRSASGAQLDEHNGHENGDGRGYHYHITLVMDGNGDLQPSFPFTIGPRFYGELPDNAMTACGGGGGGGGPGGPPPGA
ncbi:MAG: YHYH protein [Pseudomonadota bacterium]